MRPSENAEAICEVVRRLDAEEAWSANDGQALIALIWALRRTPETHALLYGLAVGVGAHFTEKGEVF